MTATCSCPPSPVSVEGGDGDVHAAQGVRAEQRAGSGRPAAATGGWCRASTGRGPASPWPPASRRRGRSSSPGALTRSSIRSSSSSLPGHVAVERHRADAELLADPAHRDGVEPLGVGDRDGRVDDRVEAQLRLRAAGLAAEVELPHQGEAAADVAAAAVLVRHGPPRLSTTPAVPKTCSPAYCVGCTLFCVQRTQFIVREESMPEPGLAIEARALSKRFKEVTALDGFDLAVPYGTVHGLLGPNGAGKTTAVRVLTTLLRGRRRRGVRRRGRRRRGPAGGAPPDRPGRPVRRGRRDPHRPAEPRAVREAVPPRPAPGQERAIELLERFDLTDAADKGVKQLQRRHAAPARPGRRA